MVFYIYIRERVVYKGKRRYIRSVKYYIRGETKTRNQIFCGFALQLVESHRFTAYGFTKKKPYRGSRNQISGHFSPKIALQAFFHELQSLRILPKPLTPFELRLQTEHHEPVTDVCMLKHMDVNRFVLAASFSHFLDLPGRFRARFLRRFSQTSFPDLVCDLS